MCLVSELQLVSKPHDVETRIHCGNVDTQGLTQSQVSSTELINVHLENITKVNQHVTGSFSSTGDIQTCSNNMGALASSGQMFGQSQLEEIEGHINMVRSKSELLS